MTFQPLDEETALEAVQALQEHGSKRAAAIALGISRSTFRNRIKSAEKQGLTGRVPKAPEGFELKQLSEQIGKDGQVKSTSVKYTHEVGQEFKLPAGRFIGKVTTQVGASGEIEKEWIRHDWDKLTPFQVVELTKDFVKTLPWTRLKAFPAQHTENENLLTIYPLADLHLSLRATAEESGEDYDLERAQNLFNEKSAQIIQKSPKGGTALVAYLGDWTHQDDDKNMTPRSGHILEVSSSIFRAVRAGVQLAILHTYRCLAHHEKVIIKVVRGNHDLHSWIGLCLALQEHFRNEPRVTVDTSEADYWFCRWGMNLIGLHHGHRMKPEEMAGSMATECAKDWGETYYRLFLHGHLHHHIAKDVLGVHVECMRTIAPPDAHHSGKYNSPRSLISITLDKEEGEQSRASVNLKPIRRKAVSLEAA
ncbi:helix-turn-helix domain-containing protein [Roseibium sp.]|uniref:helix-turn-helix domain-containing protein n=1 Tax=Roseibium sp. TaxID=1936156 RepID=UPI003B52FEE2